jgi:hypothetical protein
MTIGLFLHDRLGKDRGRAMSPVANVRAFADVGYTICTDRIIY